MRNNYTNTMAKLLGKMARDGAKTDSKMKRKLCEQELRKLQIELCRLQEWVKATGTKGIGAATSR